MDDGTRRSYPSPSYPGRDLRQIGGDTLRSPRFWLGVAASIGTIYLALRHIDLRQAYHMLGSIRLTWVSIGLCLVVITMVTKAARWRSLYPRDGSSPHMSALIPSLLIGAGINLLIPARLGELARAYALQRLEGESKVLSLSTIVVEKWADLVFLFVTFAGLLLIVPWPDWLVGWSRRLLIGAVGSTVILVVGAFSLDRAEPLVQSGSRHLPARWGDHLIQSWRAICQGMAPLRSVSRVSALLGWTALVWAFSAAANWAVLRALALPASPVIALTLLVILQAGSALPSSPARVGVFHYLAIVGLELFHVPRDEALVFAFWLHMIVVIWLITLGAMSLLWVSLQSRAATPSPGV
ncbi:MAG: flippase-like domain-containing protein [Anaerolineae bacterium]|nr:flippase-like domain-containing protein [Anaerolineae bacterium]